jgi:ribonuclease D
MIALPPLTYIDSSDKLGTLVKALAGETLIAIDTESNSLHAYRERVCLIQLSTRTADYIIDPLTIPNMQPLAPLFADPTVEKVFHAAEYDLMCMKRDFGVRHHDRRPRLRAEDDRLGQPLERTGRHEDR